MICIELISGCLTSTCEASNISHSVNELLAQWHPRSHFNLNLTHDLLLRILTRNLIGTYHIPRLVEYLVKNILEVNYLQIIKPII
jgi:hypothetical protein